MTRDELETKGKKNLILSLIMAVLTTTLCTTVVTSLVGSLVPIPFLWILVGIFTFIAVGPYGRFEVPPGYTGMLKWLNRLLPIYFCDGTGWAPRIFGFTVDATTELREIIVEIPLMTFEDKQNTEVRYEKTQIRFQIVDPRSYKLNVKPENLTALVTAPTSEATREFTGKRTFKQCKKLTDALEEQIKNNIETKLQEGENLGLRVVAIEFGSIIQNEIVKQADQEVAAREKHMNQFIKHGKKLKKEFTNLTDEQATKNAKVVGKFVEETITTTNNDTKFEVGENVTSVINNLLDLIPKKQNKPNKQEKDEEKKDE